MKRISTILLAVCLFAALSGCGRQEELPASGGSPEKENHIVRTETSHTFAGYPVVYFTQEVSPEGLLSVYEALEPSSEGTLLLKQSEEERRFSWLALTGKLLEAETVTIFPEQDGTIPDTPRALFLTHFVSHPTAGFRGTLANLASSEETGIDDILNGSEESARQLAEQAAAARDAISGSVLYLAVFDHRSSEDDSQDIAVLSSYDPVSLEQACVDMVNMTGKSINFSAHIASCGGDQVLIDAQELGLGSCTYALLNID